MGFLGLTLFIMMSQGVLNFVASPQSAGIEKAIQGLFGAVPRIAAASFIAYLISQSFDVWFYHVIHDRTGEKFLFLRNNLSTVVSQFMDSVLFFSLAFGGLVPFGILINIILTGYAIKIIVAMLDTPFMYASYFVIGEKMPDFGRKTET